jgi:hypothetical protein
MSLKQNLTTHLMERCGGIVDIKENPEVLDEIVNHVKAYLEAEKGSAPSKSSAPFGVQWMDSWVAHHVFSERISDLQSKNRAVASLLQGMVDVQFNARLAEVRGLLSRLAEPPDAGPPEPGAPPPAGPARAHTPSITIAAEPPPDAGPPEPGAPPPPPPAGPARAHNPKLFLASEPGSPPVGPAGAHGGVSTASEPGSPPVGPAGGHSGRFVTEEPEPPDGGTPEPGVPPEPPAGPDPGGPESGRFQSFADNPWILYWFISLKTPVLLDVIDLHISRRLEALQH